MKNLKPMDTLSCTCERTDRREVWNSYLDLFRHWKDWSTIQDYLTPLKYVESKEKVKMTMSQWKSSGSAILSKKECQLNMVNNWFSVHNITSTKEDPNEATTDIFQILKGKT